MPKRRKKELIHCTYFKWLLGKRHNVWIADGRSNAIDVGRHSLGTRLKTEALRLVHELDRQRAVDLGLAPKPDRSGDPIAMLDLETGLELYKKHYNRPRVAGGVKPKTAQKYRNDLNNFIQFAKSIGITVWNGVTDDVLTAFAEHLEEQGYAHKTELNHLVTVKQAIKWLIDKGHLQGVRHSELKLQKAESEPAYCWRPEEVEAMISYCRADTGLDWLAGVLVGLACTGLRIGELASLRWADIDKESGCLILADESGYRRRAGRERRQVKNSRGRSFPVHNDFAVVLEELPRVDGYIFHGPRGGRLKPDTVRNILVREVICAAGGEVSDTRWRKGVS